MMPGALDKQTIPPAELKALNAALEAGESSVAKAGESGFHNIYSELIAGVADKQKQADQAVEGVLKGENTSLHQAMIAMEEASLSFKLMVEVRNKLLESYQELMRMQV
ncbi:MAG: flagellar hook-basal body complex protein FliE [Verrucomicrobia bacterium]|nr:flagellar hook-basal body complex protein FliE [Verrucomicrobiota bacterium]